ncbi:hypothetical protein [Lentilactobacillus parakefiri]|uniref:DUF5640 domain-containing protein n=1 Tax=Lentilactobacillus parakefiri TaxID=152332 RepID=A0A224V4X8_9LACO|nr:hypothetical protein [Lentilactobacillus parakefiri]KRL74598.1 hypothetical protein FD08_GL001559 [Lentilactobacillus parakefiri DSM 10551]PAK99726.1 hypothetical protein B8W96_10140 [Lentilactobacillus parakefiri]TDG92113.1 hypothetical protein C5L28_001504 [Lentilactobacillus parakefiri]GAW72037.1 hypothetical protein LPKJCM_01145 [Lentilactobacillus parakefiri]
MKKIKWLLLALASCACLLLFTENPRVDAAGSIPNWYLGNWQAVNGKNVYVGIRRNEVMLQVKNDGVYWKPVIWKKDPQEAGVIFGTGIGSKNAKTYFVLVKQKIQKKWYMVMTMKQNKIKPSDLRKHPMIMKRY